MKQKTILITVLVGILSLIAGGLGGYALGHKQGLLENINTYEECVDAGYPIQESWPPVCTTPDGKSFTGPGDANTDEQTVHEGVIVCLPHKNGDGPHTLECAAGLRQDDNTHYGLDMSQIGGSLANEAGSNKRIKITGSLTQGEDSKYDIEGTILVSDFEFVE